MGYKNEPKFEFVYCKNTRSKFLVCFYLKLIYYYVLLLQIVKLLATLAPECRTIPVTLVTLNARAGTREGSLCIGTTAVHFMMFHIAAHLKNVILVMETTLYNNTCFFSIGPLPNEKYY